MHDVPGFAAVKTQIVGFQLYDSVRLGTWYNISEIERRDARPLITQGYPERLVAADAEKDIHDKLKCKDVTGAAGAN